MSVTTISYPDTGYFSKIVCDYIAENPKLDGFYHRFPHLKNFKEQLEEKGANFPIHSRKVLVESLLRQYQDVDASAATQKNINALHRKNTFAITTGHQLNLFTGPLYFLYKIISVINLSDKLNKEYPAQYFVPIYWMASEDHDFEEIQYFNLRGNKITWDRNSGGAVGELSTDGLATVVDILKKEFGQSDIAEKLVGLFSDAYLKHSNLAAATRYLVNELFKSYGLVIIDGNDAELKTLFAPYIKNELENKQSYNEVVKSSEALEKIGYKRQVNPRELNLFYLKKGLRERITEKEGVYTIRNTDLVFSQAEILEELEQHPERFSPNALLRPLFQEVILPNLCYVGGGGELAYWFQLHNYFKSVEIPFPILLLRNSVLLVSEKQAQKLEKLGEPIEALFLNTYDLEVKHTKQLSEIPIDFTPQRNHLQAQFKTMYKLARQTDASFLGAVSAQEKKQLNGLHHLEKRLLKAEKRKLTDQLNRLTTLQNNLFPKQSLQERQMNFSEFYLTYGEDLLAILKEDLDPLVNQFTLIRV